MVYCQELCTSIVNRYVQTMYPLRNRSRILICVSRSSLWWWSSLESSTVTLCPSAAVHARFSWVSDVTININVICFAALLTHLNPYLCSKDIASEKPMMQVGQYVFAGEYEGKKITNIFFSGFIDYSQNRCTPPPTVHDIVILLKKICPSTPRPRENIVFLYPTPI